MNSLGRLFWLLIVSLLINITGLLILVGAKGYCILVNAGLEGAWQRLVSIPLSAFSSLAVLVGGLVALCVWTWNMRQQYSQDFLKESRSFFQKSFETLNVLDDQGRPLHDRMRWLTSARLLRVAQRLGSQIELKSHRLLYEEIEHYWRNRFDEIINPPDLPLEGLPEDYFAERPDHFISYDRRRDREPLAVSSIRVLYRFVEWPEGRSDPLDNEPPFSEEELHKMEALSGPRALGRLMCRYQTQLP
jgi:hypothetical protein